MKNQRDNYFLSAIMLMEGALTEVKKLHWFSTDMNMHLLLDDIKDAINETQDKLMENYIALNLYIDKNLTPESVMVSSTIDVLDILMQISVNLLNSEFANRPEYSGIKAYVEEFIGQINSFIYKNNIINSNDKQDNFEHII